MQSSGGTRETDDRRALFAALAVQAGLMLAAPERRGSRGAVGISKW